MLKLILIITLGVPDVSAMEQAYSGWLGYTAAAHGTVDPALAAVWAAPAMAGRPFVLMQPESKENVYLRFVQVAPAPGYVPMKTFGWNAIEIMVQDPDALATRLGKAGTPFQIIGPPRPLGPSSPIRAMQVVGPAQEVLYLTRVPPGADGRPSARTFVDRPFIMIVGGPQLEVLRDFYGSQLGATLGPVAQARMTVLNKAHGFDIETTHPLAVARLSPQYSIEMDGYPQTASARPTRAGELPPAIASVSFEVDSLDGVKTPLLAPSRAIKSQPYAGRRVAMVRGAAGELIELVEAQPAR
jgi:catechol 2,3-dioxygenase-like lactoylglutathione lyase family enzyme